MLDATIPFSGNTVKGAIVAAPVSFPEVLMRDGQRDGIEERHVVVLVPPLAANFRGAVGKLGEPLGYFQRDVVLSGGPELLERLPDLLTRVFEAGYLLLFRKIPDCANERLDPCGRVADRGLVTEDDYLGPKELNVLFEALSGFLMGKGLNGNDACIKEALRDVYAGKADAF